MLPMKIKDGNNIPSWPGLGVIVIAATLNSASTPIASEGVKLRATTRGADQFTERASGSDRESRHCIGNVFSCRKRAFARMDSPIITNTKMADKISTAISTPSMPNVCM